MTRRPQVERRLGLDSFVTINEAVFISISDEVVGHVMGSREVNLSPWSAGWFSTALPRACQEFSVSRSSRDWLCTPDTGYSSHSFRRYIYYKTMSSIYFDSCTCDNRSSAQAGRKRSCSASRHNHRHSQCPSPEESRNLARSRNGRILERSNLYTATIA